ERAAGLREPASPSWAAAWLRLLPRLWLSRVRQREWLPGEPVLHVAGLLRRGFAPPPRGASALLRRAWRVQRRGVLPLQLWQPPPCVRSRPGFDLPRAA